MRGRFDLPPGAFDQRTERPTKRREASISGARPRSRADIRGSKRAGVPESHQAEALSTPPR
jgi:hypothetical protein